MVFLLGWTVAKELKNVNQYICHADSVFCTVEVVEGSGGVWFLRFGQSVCIMGLFGQPVNGR